MSHMWNEFLIIFGLRDDPVLRSVQNAHAIVQHSKTRTAIADRAATRNTAATQLLNDVLKHDSDGTA